MNIVYTFDDGYSDITAVSLLSLLKSNTALQELNIYIIDCGISAANKKMLSDISQSFGRKTEFITAPPLESLLDCNVDCKSWSMVCFVRLFYAELLPDHIETVVHVDCDTMIVGSFSALENIDLKDDYCAACYDCTPEPMRQMPGASHNKYFSNGLFVMNLKKWRTDNIKNRFLEYIEQYHDNLPHLDQDVINGTIADKIMTLPAEFNIMPLIVMYGGLVNGLFKKEEQFYTKEELDNAVRNPVMLHITGFKYYSRPWMTVSYYPYTKTWRKYAESLPEPFNYRPQKNKIGFARRFKYKMWSKLTRIPFFKKVLFNIEYK